MTERLSVIGLGRLGMPIVASVAARGQRVIGVDRDASKVKALAEGIAIGPEPDLQAMLDRGRSRITGTTSIARAVRESSMTFVVVPTPSDPATQEFSLASVLDVCGEIGAALRTKRDRHVVSISSTVMPGATGGPIRACVEETSGKRSGVDFDLCYSPEFVALGSVIRDFLAPDFVLIGEGAASAGARLASFYEAVCGPGTRIYRTGLVNAEIAKLAVNTFLTTKITFANMLARLCERIPGADVDQVTGAVGLDARIGLAYLRGGTAFGGPCLARDNLALAALARRVGASASVAEAIDAANRAWVAELAADVRQQVGSGTAGILGLAYKPETDVIDASPGLALAEYLSETGTRVVAYDPLAIDAARQVLGDGVRFSASASECVRSADVVALVTPWREFRELPPDVFARAGARRILIDCWRLLDERRFSAVCDYRTLGRGPRGAAGA